MLTETALVISVSQGRARVSLVKSEACGHCSAKNICHPSDGNLRIMEVENPVGARPGQRVLISLSSVDLLKASAKAYMLPAAAMVAGAAAAYSWAATDLWAMAGAGGGLLLSILYLAVTGRRKKGAHQPAITDIMEGRGG